MAIIETEFVELTRKLDVEAWWEENAACGVLTPDKPRCSASFSPDDHWIFEFMAVPSTLRYYSDTGYRDALHREVNAITREYVGTAFFDEDTWPWGRQPRRIENLFGCEFGYREGSTPWLMPVTDDPAEFSRVLDRAEATDLRTWSLAEDYLAEWEARKAAGKPLPELGTGSRGPATIMTSILKPETLFYWLHDHPDLMRRFRDILAAKMVEFNRILREFSRASLPRSLVTSGEDGKAEPGWWITDDNCALFNRKLYREYCYPVLERVLAALAPGDARRYQHSDSAMGHLLDMQYALGIREVNYGPTVDAGLIRQQMPDALINGQMPPMLLRNGSPEEIRQRVIADFRKAGGNGRLNVTTAGSLAAGTGVGRMRWFMQAVQECCRYDNGVAQAR
jgi:uroporphyrinogen decarboxylase